MAVTFYVANDVKEALISTESLYFDEELQAYLYDRKSEFLLGNHVDILIELDPYGDKVFADDDLRDLLGTCRYLKEAVELEELQLFAGRLYLLCESALQKRKNLVALGD